MPRQLQKEADKHYPGRVRVKTPIYNGRKVAESMGEPFQLDKTGFSFGPSPTSMIGEDFYHTEAVHTK